MAHRVTAVLECLGSKASSRRNLGQGFSYPEGEAVPLCHAIKPVLFFTIWKPRACLQNRKIDAMFSFPLELEYVLLFLYFSSVFFPGFNRFQHISTISTGPYAVAIIALCRFCPATTPHPPWPQGAPSLLGLCPWAAHRTRFEAPRDRRPWVSPAESPGRYCAPRPHGMADFNAWNIIGIFIVKGNQ